MQKTDKRIFPQKLIHLLERRTSRRNALMLLNLAFITTAAIVFYTITFHYLMSLEGKEYPFLTGLYWTFTTMTTLGLGDVFFESVIGQMFTVLVLMSGVSFYLVLIPFIIVRLFQSSARIPRGVSQNIHGHVVITHFDAVTTALIKKLNAYNVPYGLLVDGLTRATELLDHGYKVVLGSPDDPDIYRKLRFAQAAMLVASADDMTNTSISYAARQTDKNVPIVCTSALDVSKQVMRQAGVSHVLELHEMMGQSLARRVIAGDAMAHVIGRMDQLVIAEATAKGTPLSGKTLQELRLPEEVGPTVVGVWKRGHFTPATADTRITDQTALVLAGTQQQIDNYNELFCIYNVANAPNIIIGGGRVGQAMARALQKRDADYRLIEINPMTAGSGENGNLIRGDATDRKVLEEAGIKEAPSVAITTHNDNINIYLTTLARLLRPDVHIISRATGEHAAHLLHQAGADFVMSYASMGSNTIFNLLKSGNIMMVTEGVDVFRVSTPPELSGKNIAQTDFRKQTGCSIIGLRKNGTMEINPKAGTQLAENSEMIMIGTVESEALFLKRFNISGAQKD